MLNSFHVSSPKRIFLLKNKNVTIYFSEDTDASVEQVITVEEVRSTEDEKQLDSNEETDLIEENVVDLRAFRVLGPLIYVDLLELPYQAKVMNGWTIQQG